MPGDVLRTSVRVRPDWANDLESCRRCETGTRSRDATGAIHQSCAKQELADRVIEERFGPRDGQLVDERYPPDGIE